MDKKVISYQYWNKWKKEDQNLIGVYPMGGGGEFEIYYRHFFELKRLKNRVKFTPDQIVLELGCGNGRWAYELAPLVKHYVAVDFNRNAIEYCSKMAKINKLTNAEFHASSIEEFSWTYDQKIDVLYFSGVSQYLSDADLIRLLAKYRNLLSDNCIVIDRSSVNLKQRLLREEPHYFSIYRTPTEIGELFEKQKFKIIDTFQSYIFLRNAFLVTNRTLKEIAIGSIPFSFYFFLVLSKLTNLITCRKLDRYNEPYDGKDFSHDFFILEKITIRDIDGR